MNCADDDGCWRVVSYSGHGYFFNGVGRRDHEFYPWASFLDAMARRASLQKLIP